MPTPRISEMVIYSPKEQMRPDAQWGCWDCGNEDSRVKEVSKDEDHVRVRLRVCVACGASWDTEERRIARGAFFGRAATRRHAIYRKTRYQVKTCLVCGERYTGGDYEKHKAKSTAHQTVVERIRQARLDRDREYRTNWTRARRHALAANRAMHECRHCGGKYAPGTYPEHCHTKGHMTLIQERRRMRRRKNQ